MLAEGEQLSHILEDEAMLRRFATVVRDSNDAITIQDFEGNITAWNRGAELMYGYTEEEALRKSIDLLTTPDKVEEQKEFTRRLIAGEAITSFETKRVTKDGRTLDVWLTVTKLVDEFGKSIGIASTERDITQRKQTEESLREANEYLDSVINNANAPIIVWDPDFKITRFNRAFEALTGRKADEVIGKPIDILFPPSKADTTLEIFKKTKTGERLESVNSEILHREGTAKTVLWNSATLFSKDGDRPVAVIAHGLDITERKKAEKNIAESEARYRELANGISDGIAVYLAVNGGEDFVFVDLNRAGEKMDEVSRSDIIGKRVTEVFPGVREMGLLEVFRRVWRTGTPEQHPLTQYKDNRMSSWRENYVYRLHSGEIVAIFEDVTTRKLAEDALAASDARYRLIADNMTDTVWLTDLDLNMTYTSPSTVRAWGYLPEELDGLSLDKVLSPGSYELVVNVLECDTNPERLIKKDLKISHTFELEFCRKDGSKFWAEVTMTLLGDADGNPTSLMGVGRDITERRSAGEAIAASEEKYRELFDSASDAIIIADVETGTIIDINKTFEKLLGRTREELMGKNRSMLHSAEKISQYTEEFNHHVSAGYSVDLESEVVRKDGVAVPIRISSAVLEIQGRKVIQGIFRDMTERKKTENLLIRQKTLESRYTLTKIMTDVVPALLTMGRGEKSKDEFMGEMMRRLDAAFYDKYFPTIDGSLETFGSRICALMNDMGGEFTPRIDGSDLHITGAGCPWKNDISRNPILCMIDRGLIERFANKALGSISINQNASRADGDSACEFVISKTG